MSKYIIKNCPAFCDIENGTGWKEIVENTCIRPKLRHPTKCEEIDDCLLKQIVERTSKFRSAYADEILDLLEIEEE